METVIVRVHNAAYDLLTHEAESIDGTWSATDPGADFDPDPNADDGRGFQRIRDSYPRSATNAQIQASS